MSYSILIVEDQFIEANDLSSILEQGGYRVTGIARSVTEAYVLIDADFPDIVLIDIFLKGNLTGIDLAKNLTARNIAFIYLSANSNPLILAEAKATQPYGFLVKPFREKDILIALEIAIYRYNHAQEILNRHEKWLNGLLEDIIKKEAPWYEKKEMLAAAFQSFVHFDYILIDLDLTNREIRQLNCYHRVSYNEYKEIDLFSSADFFILSKDVIEKKKSILSGRGIGYRNRPDFISGLDDNKIGSQMHALYSVQSEFLLSVIDNKVNAAITFYSVQPECFNGEQVKLLNAVLPTLTAAIWDINNRSITNDKPEKYLPGKNSNKPTIFPDIVGSSPQLLKALDQVTQVAPYETSVLILGETGTGKEGLVNLIHQLSSRSDKPLIKINCAAIPESLVESELFGHEKGAFTGAIDRRIGKFELARGGTVFLDEIGEIPLDVQSKLLRVLQEKEIERLGGRHTIKTDVRIIAATNRNLHEEVAKGTFRMDLYYRINVFPITLAPLRERKDDIPLLVTYFLAQQAAVTGTPVKVLAPSVIKQLINHSWPGNIRQLLHVIERAVILCYDREISFIDFPEAAITKSATLEPVKIKLQSIEELERTHIMYVIRSCNGKISGKGGASDILQIPVTSLRVKMKKLGIEWHHTYEQ